MAGRIFGNTQRIDELNEKAIAALTTKADSFDVRAPFTLKKAAALLNYCKDFCNLLGHRVIDLHDLHLGNEAQLDARLKRVEACQLDLRDATTGLPPNLEDQISQSAIAVKRLQQQISALTKQVASLDRKVHS